MRNRGAFRRLIVALAGFMLAVSACSGSDDEATVDDNTSSTVTESDIAAEEQAAPAPTDFCSEADAFINDRSVTDVASFSADFFADVDDRLSRLVETAPEQIRDDLEALQEGFANSDKIFAEFDYDVTDERLGPALDAVDNSAMLTATDEIQLYLAESCELEPVGSLDPEQVVDIMNSFGVDRPMAECLNLELGDVANIDPEELTPELLSQSVCGTSLIELLSGGQPTT